MSHAISVLVASAALCFTLPAYAQKPLFGAFAEGGSGITIGGGDGFSVIHRARTLVRVGMTLQVDELPNEEFSFAVLSDVEPNVALGIDGQWGYWVARTFLFEAGPVAYFVPQTLLGVTGGLRVRIPIGKMFSLLPGFSMSGFFAGSDLPDNSAIITGMLVLGLHANL